MIFSESLQSRHFEECVRSTFKAFGRLEGALFEDCEERIFSESAATRTAVMDMYRARTLIEHADDDATMLCVLRRRGHAIVNAYVFDAMVLRFVNAESDERYATALALLMGLWKVTSALDGVEETNLV